MRPSNSTFISYKKRNAPNFTTTKNSHTITLTNSDKFYGLGICYNSKIFQLTKITEYGKRVCFYQLTSKSNNKEKIDIINVYASTNILASSKPEELEEFYIHLKSCMKNLKSNIWFIGGDFNSKIGKNKSSTQGGHNKDCQNNNKLILEEFMQENNLFASNTAFKKQSKKKTTLVGHLKGKTVYNVIDFI